MESTSQWLSNAHSPLTMELSGTWLFWLNFFVLQQIPQGFVEDAKVFFINLSLWKEIMEGWNNIIE